MADKPFPRSEAELNLFLQNLAAKLTGYQVALGLTLAEVTRVTDDAANLNSLLNSAQQINDSKDAFYAYKDTLIKGDPTTPTPAIPVLPVVTLPETVTVGIIPNTRATLKRIKASAGYTEQIGEDLGLVDNGGGGGSPETIIPVLKLKALSGSEVEITFGKQGLAAIAISYKRKGDVKWQPAGTYISSPAIHVLAPLVEGEPETREYRGILLRKNNPVTQFSATYNIVTTP